MIPETHSSMSPMRSENRRSSPKRRRSYGRLSRRRNGSWIVQFVEPGAPLDAKGRRKYTTRAVESKAEGEAFLKELRRTILAGTYLKPPPEPEPEGPRAGDLTLDEAVRAYVESRRAAGRAESTLRRYEGNLKILQMAGLAARRVADLRLSDIEGYLAWRRRRCFRTTREGDLHRIVLREGGQASNAAINRDLLLVRAALARLRRLGDLDADPLAELEMLREPKSPRVALSKEEIRSVLAACGPWLRPFVLAAAYTGARAGELARLTWGDLSFERKEIRLWRPKTQNWSAIHLHPVLEEELRNLKERRRREGRAGDADPVFLTRWGNPMRYHGVAWRLAIRRAGLSGRKGLCFHVLRHSFAVHFLEGGAAVSDLKEILGHASISTTEIYAKSVSARAKASIEALDLGA